MCYRKKRVSFQHREINKLRKEDIAEVKNNNITLSNEIKMLKNEVSKLMQDKLSNKLTCFGLPYTGGENFNYVIIDMLKRNNISNLTIVNLDHDCAMYNVHGLFRKQLLFNMRIIKREDFRLCKLEDEAAFTL